MKDSRFNLLAALAATGAGLVTAVVCFGFLQSSASGTFGSSTISLGGAILGALVSASLTHKFFSQLQASSSVIDKLQAQTSREISELRQANEDLRRKVIRGAPRPDGFVTEVDERQQLVMSRPDDWDPIGANIFAFECPQQKLRDGDMFPPSVRVTYYPEQDASDTGREEFYQKVRQNFERGPGRYGGPYRCETIFLGSESNESLKLIARTYVKVTTQTNQLTQEVEHFRAPVTQEEFSAHVAARVSSIVEDLHASEGTVGWKQLQQVRGIVNSLKDAVEIELEHGRLEYRDLREFVTAGIAQQQSSRDAPEAAKELSNLPLTKSAAESVAQTVEASIEVLPVAQTTVWCYHTALKRIFYFEFEDNSSDYSISSSVFSKIIHSVRFLA